MSSLRSTSALVVLLGCASAPVRPAQSAPARPEVAETQVAEMCPVGARIVFHEVREDGSRIIHGVHCGAETQLELGEHYEWGEGGSERITIDSAEADAIWQTAQEGRWRTWQTCEHEGARPRWEVEVDDGSTALMYAHCDGHLPNAWSATLEALRDSKPEVESFEWPFGGDYWGDELGYYRSAQR